MILVGGILSNPVKKAPRQVFFTFLHQFGCSSRHPSVWSKYSDRTRPHPKWWFRKGNALISGKSMWVKFFNLGRSVMNGQDVATFVPSIYPILIVHKIVEILRCGIIWHCYPPHWAREHHFMASYDFWWFYSLLLCNYTVYRSCVWSFGTDFLLDLESFRKLIDKLVKRPWFSVLHSFHTCICHRLLCRSSADLRPSFAGLSSALVAAAAGTSPAAREISSVPAECYWTSENRSSLCSYIYIKYT